MSKCDKCKKDVFFWELMRVRTDKGKQYFCWSCYDEKEKEEHPQKLESDHLNEIKDLLKKHGKLSEIESKVLKWKEQGYDVKDIEIMIEDYKKEYSS